MEVSLFGQKFILDDPRINDPQNYVDEGGIVHVVVRDTNQDYKLIDGKFVPINVLGERLDESL